jgi:hypothetical protein
MKLWLHWLHSGLAEIITLSVALVACGGAYRKNKEKD